MYIIEAVFDAIAFLVKGVFNLAYAMITALILIVTFCLSPFFGIVALLFVTGALSDEDDNKQKRDPKKDAALKMAEAKMKRAGRTTKAPRQKRSWAEAVAAKRAFERGAI